MKHVCLFQLRIKLATSRQPDRLISAEHSLAEIAAVGRLCIAMSARGSLQRAIISHGARPAAIQRADSRSLKKYAQDNQSLGRATPRMRWRTLQRGAVRGVAPGSWIGFEPNGLFPNLRPGFGAIRRRCLGDHILISLASGRPAAKSEMLASVVPKIVPKASRVKKP